MSFLPALLVKNCYDQSGNLMPSRPAIQITGSGVTTADNSSLGGTGATVYTISSTPVSWANDLLNSSGSAQYVSALSYSSSAAGGAIAINGTGTLLVWAATNTNPTITQASASGNGATTDLAAQSSSGANGNGGTFRISGGDLNGSGHRGSVQLCLGYVSHQPMVEVAEPVVGQRVVSLCRTSAITATQLPSGSGDGVVYLAAAASNPTVAPISGITLYAQGGTLLGLWASGIRFNAGVAAVSILQGATASATGGNTTIGAQAATTNGGSLILQGGAGNSLANSGFVQILTADGSGSPPLQLGGQSTDQVIVGSQAAFTYMQVEPLAIIWGKSVTSPLIAQNTQDAGSNPQNLTLQPQAPNAGAGSTATGTPGSLIVNVAVPVSTGTEAGVQVTRGGAFVTSIQPLQGSPTLGALYQGPAARTINNFIVCSDGSTTTYINAPGAAAVGELTVNFSYVSATWTANGMQLFTATPSLGGGTSVLGVTNASVAPTTNPSGGGILYASGGAGKWRGSSGTVTTFAAADLDGFLDTPGKGHCPSCGTDFAHEWSNDAYGTLTVCMKCLTDEMGERPWIIRKAA